MTASFVDLTPKENFWKCKAFSLIARLEELRIEEEGKGQKG